MMREGQSEKNFRQGLILVPKKMRRYRWENIVKGAAVPVEQNLTSIQLTI